MVQKRGVPSSREPDGWLHDLQIELLAKLRGETQEAVHNAGYGKYPEREVLLRR